MLRSQKRLKSRGFLRLYKLRVASKEFIYFLQILFIQYPLFRLLYKSILISSVFSHVSIFALINNDIKKEITLNNNYLRFSQKFSFFQKKESIIRNGIPYRYLAFCRFTSNQPGTHQALQNPKMDDKPNQPNISHAYRFNFFIGQNQLPRNCRHSRRCVCVIFYIISISPLSDRIGQPQQYYHKYFHGLFA